MAALLVLFAALPVVARSIGEPFYMTLVARILIFALAATGLNLLLGYGGLVSFGHALFVGLGAYVVGILSAHGIGNGWLHLVVTIALCALVALVTGSISLRTSGMAFIMITLAFAQMFYFLGVSLKQYGGDDGLQITERSDLSPLFSISEQHRALLFTLVAAGADAVSVLASGPCAVRPRAARAQVQLPPHARRSAFRCCAISFAAYVISGCICGVAGFLLAQPDAFRVAGLHVLDRIGRSDRHGHARAASRPSWARWSAPSLFVMLETVLAAYTQHWMLVLGPIIVLIALFAKRGIYGFVGAMTATCPNRSSASAV